MTRSILGYVYVLVIASCFVGGDSSISATVSFSDDRATTIDSAREFRIFPVAAEPGDVVVGVEAAVSFSRFPDEFDNPMNPFYEDIRIALISPEQTFVPLIDFDSFDTAVPDLGFTGTLTFRDDAPLLIGDENGDQRPDGRIVEGVFRPASPFDSFIGERAAGGWILMIEDRLGGTKLDYLGAEFSVHTRETPSSSCDSDRADCQIHIDELTVAIKNQSTDLKFDVNGDGSVSVNDRRHWIVELNNTYFGDSNLDGEFDSSDFISVFQAAQYEDGVGGNSTWATGDWSGDCDFDSGDFIVAFQEAGYDVGPRDTVAVPDSSRNSWIVTIVIAGACRRRMEIRPRTRVRQRPAGMAP